MQAARANVNSSSPPASGGGTRADRGKPQPRFAPGVLFWHHASVGIAPSQQLLDALCHRTDAMPSHAKLKPALAEKAFKRRVGGEARLVDKYEAKERAWQRRPGILKNHHRVLLGDSRELVGDPESVHLVVTSPPYWNLKEYAHDRGGAAAWAYRRPRRLSQPARKNLAAPL